MLIGTRTSAPEAQQAVVQARLDYQAALDHMKHVLNTNYIKQAQTARGATQVASRLACPECGERRMGQLLIVQCGDPTDETLADLNPGDCVKSFWWVQCKGCDTQYELDFFGRVSGKPWVAPNGLVGPQNGCPNCHNRLMEQLRVHGGVYEDWVTCDRCGHNYYIG